MRARPRLAAIAALAGLLPGTAEAHNLLKGAGDIYAGFLHPVVVPAEALALIATGLLLGTSGKVAARIGLPALAAGLAAGLAIASWLSTEALSTTLLLAVALLAASIVTAGPRVGPAFAAGLAFAGGTAVGFDAMPESPTLSGLLAASAATVAGGTVAATIIAALALDRTVLWQAVATRIAGSWITASTILYFAWRLAAPAA
jgi:hypothetical protein